MLSENDIKEELSIACVRAVAARAGFSCEEVRKDRDSIDVEICAKGRLSPESVLFSPKLALQLKATAMDPPAEDRFKFDLPVKNYEELRATRRMVPALLAVFVLPTDPGQWLRIDEEALVLRRCLYWTSLAGAPPTDNVSRRTVYLERSRVLDPESLRRLLVRVSCEEEIRHDG